MQGDVYGEGLRRRSMKSRQIVAAKKVVKGLNAMLQNPWTERLFTQDEIGRLNALRIELERAIRRSKLDELQGQVQVRDAEE